jgi:hypothetical protein
VQVEERRGCVGARKEDDAGGREKGTGRKQIGEKIKNKT